MCPCATMAIAHSFHINTLLSPCLEKTKVENVLHWGKKVKAGAEEAARLPGAANPEAPGGVVSLSARMCMRAASVALAAGEPRAGWPRSTACSGPISNAQRFIVAHCRQASPEQARPGLARWQHAAPSAQAQHDACIGCTLRLYAGSDALPVGEPRTGLLGACRWRAALHSGTLLAGEPRAKPCGAGPPAAHRSQYSGTASNACVRHMLRLRAAGGPAQHGVAWGLPVALQRSSRFISQGSWRTASRSCGQHN